MVGTLLEFNRFLFIFGSMLGPFWLILAPFGLPRGSQGRLPNLAPFLVLCGAHFVLIFAPFWTHFGTQNQHCSAQKSHRFFN